MKQDNEGVSLVQCSWGNMVGDSTWNQSQVRSRLLDAEVIAKIVAIGDIRSEEGNTRIALHDDHPVVKRRAQKPVELEDARRHQLLIKAKVRK